MIKCIRRFIKQLFCLHEYDLPDVEFCLHNVYTACEVCKKCGKLRIE